MTRFALKHLWRPVGSGIMPKEEVGFLVDYLFADDEGALWRRASIAASTASPVRTVCTSCRSRSLRATKRSPPEQKLFDICARRCSEQRVRTHLRRCQ